MTGYRPAEGQDQGRARHPDRARAQGARAALRPRSTATAARSKKSAGSSRSPASASARSRPRRCARCAIRPASGSSKASSKPTKRSPRRRDALGFETSRPTPATATLIPLQLSAPPRVYRTAMNHDEEHDELWQLLGKANQPQPSPFFSRNVLRAIREELIRASGPPRLAAPPLAIRRPRRRRVGAGDDRARST